MERVQPNKTEMSIHPPSSSGKKEMDYPLALDHVCTIISNCSYNKFRILTKICTIGRVICYAIFLGPIALAMSTRKLMLCLHMENSNPNICKIIQRYDVILLRYFYAGNTFGSSQFSLTLTTKVAMSS